MTRENKNSWGKRCDEHPKHFRFWAGSSIISWCLFYVLLLLSWRSASLACSTLKTSFCDINLSLGPSPKILQGMRSPSLSLKLWKLKGIKTTASEVAVKPKQGLGAANLFSDSVTWHRHVAQVKKQRKAIFPLPTSLERKAFSRTRHLL